MLRPESCPQPILVSGFNEETNNTDEYVDNIIENNFEEEEMTFASSNEPTGETGPYQSNTEFILSQLDEKGKEPTLLFEKGDNVRGHKVNLIDLFPLIFPYGWGGPDQIRRTKLSKGGVLRH